MLVSQLVLFLHQTQWEMCLVCVGMFNIVLTLLQYLELSRYAFHGCEDL